MISIRVLIVEDHPVIRQGIHSLLSGDPEIEIVGETANGDEALQLARDLRPDVMILDMQLEGISGIQVAQTLQKEGSNVRVLAFSAHNDRIYVKELLMNGASGFLIKDESPEFLLAAVRGVAQGERGWYSRQINAQLLNWQPNSDPTRSGLTLRENQVLKLIVDAKTNREIGYLLSISEKTVEKHLETIFRKLGVSSRTEAAVQAVREEIDSK